MYPLFRNNLFETGNKDTLHMTTALVTSAFSTDLPLNQFENFLIVLTWEVNGRIACLGFNL